MWFKKRLRAPGPIFLSSLTCRLMKVRVDEDVNLQYGNAVLVKVLLEVESSCTVTA